MLSAEVFISYEKCPTGYIHIFPKHVTIHHRDTQYNSTIEFTTSWSDTSMSAEQFYNLQRCHILLIAGGKFNLLADSFVSKREEGALENKMEFYFDTIISVDGYPTWIADRHRDEAIDSLLDEQND